jgi:hypothetical protein
MLDRFPRLRRDEFPIDDVRFEELQHRVQMWRVGALELSDQRTEVGLEVPEWTSGTELHTPDRRLGRAGSCRSERVL